MSDDVGDFQMRITAAMNSKTGLSFAERSSQFRYLAA